MRKRYSFQFLWIGQTFANFGDSLYILAIVTFIYETFESATLAALVPVLRLAAMFISSAIAPMIFQRFPLLKVLIFSQFMQTVLLAIFTTFFFLVDTVSLLLTALFIIITSFFDGWTTPARGALIPRLVPEEKRVDANSLIAISDQMSLFIGWGAGGWLVETFGSFPVLLGTAALFLISTISLFFIVDPVDEKLSLPKDSKGWEQIKEGWQILRSHPLLSKVAIMDFLDNAANSVWAGAIMLAFVTSFLNEDKTWWGYLNGVYFAGAFLGGLIALKLSKQMCRHLQSSLVWGEMSLVGLTLLYALIPLAPISVLLCLLMGPPTEWKEIAKNTLVQSSATPDKLPIVLAALNMIRQTAFGLSVLAMGWVTDMFSAQYPYLISTVLILLAGWIAILIKKQSVQTSTS